MSTPLTAIVTAADVTARLSTQAYVRLFAKSGGGTADTTYRDLCIAEANSRIRTLTGAGFPDGLYLTGDTLDAEAVGRGVDLVIAIASSRHLATEETSGYARIGAKAEEFFRAINRDRDARLAGSSTSPPLPRATLRNLTTSAGAPTNDYVRAADAKDNTGF